MPETTDTLPIRFTATVARVTTLADGGLRVTLDLPENAILAVAELMEAKRLGVVLGVTAEAIEPKGQDE
jgi:hypothetical protein